MRGLLCTFSDNLGGNGLQKHKGPIPWSIEENHDLVFSFCSIDYSFSIITFKFGWELFCPIMCFLDFLTSVWVTENAVGIEHKSVTQWLFRSWMSSLRALTSRIGWVSVHKTIQFTSESLVALLIMAKAWWQWWDLATNVSKSVWWFQLLSLLLSISFNFWYLFSGSCVVAKSENMSQITILEIDYTDTTRRISMSTIDL